MTTFRELRGTLVKRHEDGESYQTIGDSLDITKGTVGRILEGIRPGKEICARLGIDPNPKVMYRRRRRSAEKRLAQILGYPNWDAYTTAMLKIHKDELWQGENHE